MTNPHETVAPLDAARIASARRTLAVLLALSIALPVGCEALFERQSHRLDALASHGATATGEVTSAASAFTEYRYVVDRRTFTGNVAREGVSHTVGAAVPVRYLPDDPSFSRPVADARELDRERASQRSVATKVVVGVGVFFLAFAAMTLRELRRLMRGVDPRSDEALRARRNEALALCGAIVLAVGAAHASDAASRGESRVPVALGLALGAAVLFGTIAFLSGGGASQLESRSARMLRWAIPLSIAAAALRLIAWLVAR